MNLRLYDKKRNSTIIEKEYPKGYVTQNECIWENTTQINHYLGNGFYKEILFDGVHIGFGNTHLRDAIQLHFDSDFETIEMHFALKGKSAVTTNWSQNDISFSANQHNIIYANGISGKMRWETEQFQLCEINLMPQFFKKYLPENHAVFDAFRNAIEKGKSGLLSKQNRSISLKMYEILDEIIYCERKGIFKRMFLEAKVIELLLLQLEQFMDDAALNSSMKKTDADKIYAVRELIIENLDASYSLVDLAHQVGTNEFMLKKGFKELFGTTVFGFWNDAKMDQAKLLLAEKNLSVGEVSHQIGYKNPRHFSAAFKRKFGVLPSHIRK